MQIDGGKKGGRDKGKTAVIRLGEGGREATQIFILPSVAAVSSSSSFSVQGKREKRRRRRRSRLH